MEKIRVIRNEYEPIRKARIFEYEFNGKIFTTTFEEEVLYTKEYTSIQDADYYLKIMYTDADRYEPRKMTNTIKNMIALAMVRFEYEKKYDKFYYQSMVYRFTPHEIEHGEGTLFESTRKFLAENF